MGGPIIAPLARTADSRLVVVRSFRTMILEGGQPVATIDYPGETIAPAAVSHSHIFLSTTGAMRSYDARSPTLVGELSWFGSGQSSPAIAPSGRVYALASNILFIWPGPDTGTQDPSRDVAPRPREGLLDPGAEPARRLPAWPRAAAASARLPAESCSGNMDGWPPGKERQLGSGASVSAGVMESYRGTSSASASRNIRRGRRRGWPGGGHRGS